MACDRSCPLLATDPSTGQKLARFTGNPPLSRAEVAPVFPTSPTPNAGATPKPLGNKLDRALRFGHRGRGRCRAIFARLSAGGSPDQGKPVPAASGAFT